MFKNKMIWKDIFSSIRHSKGRFLSIFSLMLLGAFVLVGLVVTGPDMRQTGWNYFQQLNAADLTLIADKGIDQEDVFLLNQAGGLQNIEYGYLKDVTFEGKQDSIRLFSKGDKVSDYEVTEGRLPQNDQEIALDAKFKDQYTIGENLRFDEKEDVAGRKVLKQHHFQLVGFVRSTEIISDVNQGISMAGTGSLKGYGVLSEEAFDSDIYMIARLKFEDLSTLDPASKTYEERLDQHKEKLEDLLKSQPFHRLEAIQKEANEKIDSHQDQLNEKKAELKSKQDALRQGRLTLDNYHRKLAEGQNELAAKLSQANQQFTVAEGELQSGSQRLDQEQGLFSQAEDMFNQKKEAFNASWAQCQDAKKRLEAAHLPIPEDLTTKENQLLGMQKILNEKEEELAQKRALLQAASQQLDDKTEEYRQAQAAYQSQKRNGESQLASAEKELAQKEQDYQAKKKEFDEKVEDAKQTIEDKQKKIDDFRALIDHMSLPKYYLYNRKEIPGGEGYKIYYIVSNVIDALAKVFPIFLYFVAALVTLTTMTRFVEEERIKTGTLKALGYEDKDILKKFTFYGIASSLSGTVVGIILGHTLLPYIVYNAYRTGFALPAIEYHFHWKFSLVALVLAMASAVIPAYFVGREELTERPAQLLLPKVPSGGSRIMLERIPFLWKRMSFTHKVTARNLFRYKKRMFMTIFGVAGSIAMLFTGYAVQSSIANINQRQFTQLLKYDLIVAENDYVSDKDREDLDNRLKNESIAGHTSIHYEDLHQKTLDKQEKQDIKLLVPTQADLSDYVCLQNRSTGEKIDLSDEGIVISERLAHALNAKVGDTVTFEEDDKHSFEAKVTGITEMYMGHFVFTTPKGYEQMVGKDMDENAHWVQLKDRSIANTESTAAYFMESSAVSGVIQNTMLINQVQTIVEALDKIMTVLIIIASLLGIVILYNLTNLNVAERIRELSTIKVLGFYDKEVTLYIYRETFLLTIIGIFVGYGIGELLHRYILEVVPPADVMFDPALKFKTFLIPAFIILVVTAILAEIIHRKLKVIDMLEALKSVE